MIQNEAARLLNAAEYRRSYRLLVAKCLYTAYLLQCFTGVPAKSLVLKSCLLYTSPSPRDS